MHRDMPGGRIVFQPVENRPAGHVGQIDVQGDGARGEFPGQSQRGSASKSNQDLDAPVVREVHQDSRKGDIVFDNQQDRVAGADQVSVVVDFNIVHTAVGAAAGGGRIISTVLPLDTI